VSTDSDLIPARQYPLARAKLRSTTALLATAPPPHGAAVVRASIAPRQTRRPEARQTTLELGDVARRAFAGTTAEGYALFEIVIADEVFPELRCSIAQTPDGVLATFFAADVNTRRLLEAEAPRLRLRLEERGLKVAEISIATPGPT